MTHEQQTRYDAMIADGQSPMLAELLALRIFPGVHGLDGPFMAGTHAQDTPLDNYRYKTAAEQGVDTNGKRYLAGMARFPGDPEAWISNRSDILRLCAQRGWNSHGMVEYEAPITEPAPAVAIAPDIVKQHVEACLRAFPEGDHTPQLKADIEESVTNELSGAVDLDTSNHVSDYSYDDAIAISEQRD